MPSLYMPSASGSPSVFIPSVSEYLQFYSIVPCSTSHPTVSHYTSRLTAHYLLSLYYLSLDILSLSVAPYSIFPSAIFYADGLWSAFPSAFTYTFWLGWKIIKWVASSCRAFNVLDTWWFPIGYAPDKASLRLLRLFIPYIMGLPPSFLLFHFCWSSRERPSPWALLTCCPIYVSYCIAVLGSVPSRKTIYQ